MESDSSDDEINWTLFLAYIDQLPTRTIRDRSNPFNLYDDVEFRSRFRLTKECVGTLLGLIENNLEFNSRRNVPVSPLNQLLIALRFYSCSSFQVGLWRKTFVWYVYEEGGGGEHLLSTSINIFNSLLVFKF